MSNKKQQEENYRKIRKDFEDRLEIKRLSLLTKMESLSRHLNNCIKNLENSSESNALDGYGINSCGEIQGQGSAIDTNCTELAEIARSIRQLDKLWSDGD